MRDYSPEELDVWRRHADEARAASSDLRDVLRVLHAELVAKGFLREGSWDSLLLDIQDDDVE